jgi:membrane protease subunit HflK
MYSNVTKVLVDSKQGTNLLYLPLDKIIQMTGQVSQEVSANTPAATPTTPPAVGNTPTPDTRSRDTARDRTRESR